ncbi:MAG TPA: FAD:protein FMN transferase [Anditalea sp.]|nr:FAD:protein FMN transferase [Anditalea sp.]
MKKKTISIWLMSVAIFMSAIGLWAYMQKDSQPFVFMEGKALGVFYSISFQGDAALEIKLDSIINRVDLALNTGRPGSEVSYFNRNGYVDFRSPFLHQALLVSQEYSEKFNGAVNHTLLPLIEAWGQDFSNKRQITPEKIEELKKLCQPQNLEISQESLSSKFPGVRINLSYMDKGFLIDLLADYLKGKGVQNFQIEFGTDAISYGKNPKNNDHRLVVIQPESTNESKSIITETKLVNRAYSSSGNYEKFYVDEKGIKHSHLIDPRTGMPIENKILSAHIKAPTCLQADAMATVCMILTLEESIKIITDDPNLEGFIVYNDHGLLKTWKSAGFDISKI